MRNNLFILLLILAAGCTKNSHSLDNGQPLDAYIFIDANVTKTKGNLIEGEYLPMEEGTAFGVWGARGDDKTHIFDTYTTGKGNSRFNNVAKMHRPVDDDPFIYDELAMWTKNEDHSFYAYYPYDAESITEFSYTDDEPYLLYSQPTELAEMEDILTSAAENLTYTSNNPVEMLFSHRLFALDVVIKNTLPYELVLTKANVTIETYSGAKLYFDNSIQTDSNIEIYHSYIDNDVTIDAASESGEPFAYNLNEKEADGNSFLLLPDNTLKVVYSISFEDENGKTVNYEDKSYTFNNIEFTAGKKYALVLTRKGTTFTPQITEWTSKGVEHTFN